LLAMTGMPSHAGCVEDRAGQIVAARPQDSGVRRDAERDRGEPSLDTQMRVTKVTDPAANSGPRSRSPRDRALKLRRLNTIAQEFQEKRLAPLTVQQRHELLVLLSILAEHQIPAGRRVRYHRSCRSWRYRSALR
jgi:hypothetical protein